MNADSHASISAKSVISGSNTNTLLRSMILCIQEEMVDFRVDSAKKTEDLTIASSLKWAEAWHKLAENVPSIIWQSRMALASGKSLNYEHSPTNSPSLNDGGFSCSACGRVYKLKSSLRNHQKWECGKEPQFQCPHCVYRAKQKMHISRHMERMHKEKLYSMDSMA
ncbi:hypothetical protein TKK_0011311 [Trichogramma kaykai]